METPRPNLLKALDYSALQQCMHCGLCLPTCPTYVDTGRERNSPRGRISLMRAIADGQLETTRSFAEEMSFCVGCLACTSACPAGVDYAELLEHARGEVEASGVMATPTRTALRWALMRQLFTRPRLLRFVGRLLWLYQKSGAQWTARTFGLVKLLPKTLHRLEPSAPTIKTHFSDALIGLDERAMTQPARYHVAVLTGCVQDLAYSDVNRATVDVLLANGCDVTTPRLQSCCGSLHAHNGDLDTAKLLAKRQLDEIDPRRFDAIISNAAGCGSHLKHYDRLLADDAKYAERAKVWSEKLRDISEWLVEIGFRAPQASAAAANSAGGMAQAEAKAPTNVTYHEACHLCHGQSISRQPREILKAIPGIVLRESAESTWCCGSAGIYSITQPEMATKLLKRKLRNLRATGAKIVASANPGCSLHIATGARLEGKPLELVHPVVLLAQAYAREKKLQP